MIFCFGRDNLALTVFFPRDCINNCAFCCSKEKYKSNPPSEKRVIHKLKKVLNEYSYPIKDVVFTGGEPMADIELLKKMVDLVPSKYNIYINTTFTKKNSKEFIDFVNDCEKIKGVNISRHSETYEKDSLLFCDIENDDKIKEIKKQVRINCVIKNQDISKIIERWKETGVHLYFRKDFNIKQSYVDLHNPYEEIVIKIISEGFKFKGHTQCNVCDTTIFEKDGQIVAYHKGQKKSSIKAGIYIEINDLIIDQEGNFCFDWEENDLQTVYELEMAYKKRKAKAYGDYVSCYCGQNYCGGNRGCGGGC